jgi:hypothetical protein
MSDHLSAWAGSGINFRARTPEQRQRLAEAKAERRKVWRFRARDDGTLERKQFASRDHVPSIEGWARNEKAACHIAARLLPSTQPVELPSVIPLPAPPRYNRDKPRCGAKTRKGTPCQAQGNGRGGRCRNHGGMSTGARTPEGRERCRLAPILARARASSGAAAPLQSATENVEIEARSRSKRGANSEVETSCR